MSTLTAEEREMIRQGGGEPPRLVDPETNQQYVLVAAEVYDRLRALMEPEPRELYPALERALRDEGWNDAQMDDYNRYA